MSEWDEMREMLEEEREEILPYGIKPREVYYMCLLCGNIMSKRELDQYEELICSKCGGRIFIKLRSPVLPPRRVYAI